MTTVWRRSRRRPPRRRLGASRDQLRATVYTPETLHHRDYNPERMQTPTLSELAATLGLIVQGERLIDAEPDIAEALAEAIDEVVSPGEELDPSTLLDDALAHGR